jgi:hypothetical protein
LATAKEVRLEVNAEKIKYMCMSHQQNAEQNDNTQTANKTFENMESSNI